jgi:magnesium chelatase accessory protein
MRAGTGRFVTQAAWCVLAGWTGTCRSLGDPEAPVALLVHGAGAATHSFRGLIPLLSGHYRVIAIDLPGHGFTRGARRRI